MPVQGNPMIYNHKWNHTDRSKSIPVSLSRADWRGYSDQGDSFTAKKGMLPSAGTSTQDGLNYLIRRSRCFEQEVTIHFGKIP